MLEKLLPSYVFLQLAPILLGEENEKDNSWMWKPSQTGNFMVKTAYNLAHLPPDDTRQPWWKEVWKLRLPQRVKTTLWLLLHGKLLTNAKRCKRGIASDPHCKYCLGHVEDLNHLFRTYPKVTPIWQHLMEP